MTNLRKRLLTAVVALGLGAGAFALHAAEPGCGYGMGPGRFGDHAKFSERMKERMDKRLGELHDKLKLTAAQEPAWNTFTQKVRPGTPPARPDSAEFAKLSAPERAERMLGWMKEGEQRMAARVATMKDFYATLTPEQQKIFNDEYPFGRHQRFSR